MDTRIFKRARKQPKPLTPLLAEGHRIYCVGDIHGRADLLEKLHGKILADACGFQGEKTVVYLGDYIDRGEASREVIEILLSESLDGFNPVFLRGNHEQALLNFLDNPLQASAWLHFGGREALASYGVALAYIPTQNDIPGLAEQFRDALPTSHKTFTETTRTHWHCGGYYFVHAGIRPGVGLERQSVMDQLMIRDEFLFSNRDHGAIIVHGHTITPEVELLPNRIGIDTGAYDTGVLSCVVLEGNEQQFLQTT